MISSEEALETILKNTQKMKNSVIKLTEATGFVTSRDIYSEIDFPPFDQSAMDGYALKYEDFENQNKIKVIGEVQAGKIFEKKIENNQAVRIFTGAKVPEGADTVVMQEKVSIENGFLKIEDNTLKQGSNIRPQGSQTKKGQLALPSGKTITPGTAGYLAGLGIYKVNVIKKPKVCIITTGKELAKQGEKIEGSKIFESNSVSLKSALSQLNIKKIKTNTVDDIPEEIENCIKNNIKKCDMMIVTGGVSVGDYDFVVDSMKNCGVTKVFHKVKQKPGKPLYFGKLANTIIFGLPGNPSAVLTCFYIYVLPAILKMTGHIEKMQKINVTLQNDFTKKSGLTYFLKGEKSGYQVKILHSQESYQMNSYTEADCIIKLDEDKTIYKKGDEVEIYNI